MVNPGAFSGSRREFLAAQKDVYAAAVAANHVADTVADIQRRYFKRYPMALPHNEEPSQEWLDAIDDSAPDSELVAPDINALSAEAYEIAKVQYDTMIKDLKMRKEQIKRRLSYQHMKTRDAQTSFVKGSSDPLALLTAKLTGESIKKPRLKTAYNIWGPENRFFIDPIFAQRVKDGNVPAKNQAALRSSIYKEMFDELPVDEQQEWVQRAEFEHREALEDIERRIQSGPLATPEARQRIIQALPKFVEPILDLISDYTGWKVTLIAGGPEPADGGRLNMISIHSGVTSGSVKMDFGRSERSAYRAHVIPTFGAFLKKCYSIEECRSRALPTDSGAIKLSALEGEDAVNVHRFEDPKPVQVLNRLGLPVESQKWKPAPSATQVPHPPLRFGPPSRKKKPLRELPTSSKSKSSGVAPTTLPSTSRPPTAQESASAGPECADSTSPSTCDDAPAPFSAPESTSALTGNSCPGTNEPQSILQPAFVPDASHTSSSLSSSPPPPPPPLPLSRAPTPVPSRCASRAPTPVPSRCASRASTPVPSGRASRAPTPISSHSPPHAPTLSQSPSPPHAPTLSQSPSPSQAPPVPLLSPAGQTTALTHAVEQVALPSHSTTVKDSAPDTSLGPRTSLSQEPALSPPSPSRPTDLSDAAPTPTPMPTPPLDHPVPESSLRAMVTAAIGKQVLTVKPSGAATVPDPSTFLAPTTRSSTKSQKRKTTDENDREGEASQPAKRTRSSTFAIAEKRKAAGSEAGSAPKKQKHAQDAEDPAGKAFNICIPSGCPPWTCRALKLLTAVDLGVEWQKVVRAWLKFEKGCKFKEDGPKIGAQHRPQAISDWIQRARPPTYRPKISNLTAFEASFKLWWKSLQPDWRIIEGSDELQRCQGDWEVLHRSGKNGILSVIAGLFFWGLAASASDSNKMAWRVVVDDVLYALICM